MSLPERIALVGFMGAGKSTVGHRLAAQTGYRFVDSDTEVESKAGATVAEIFLRQGEETFRELERQAVQEALSSPGIIMATGGGAFAQAAGADAILRVAFTIHLACDFDIAFARVAGFGGRPLVERGKAAVEALFAERKDKYSRAHATVDTSHKSPDEVVKDILALLASSSLVHPCAT